MVVLSVIRMDTLRQTSVQSLYGKIPDMLRNSTDSQCYNWIIGLNLKDKTIQYCSIGTIYHQMGFNKMAMHFSEAPRREFLKLTNIRDGKNPPYMECPDCGAKCMFRGLLAHLNDKHRYPFAVVADKLEIAKPYDNTKSRLQQFRDMLKTIC